MERSTKKARVIAFIPDGEYYYQKGITAYQKGDLNRAKKFVERAINFNPSDPEYLCQEAAILAELELYEESNQLLKKVVKELDDSMTECYFFMANNYAYLGRYEEAMRELKKYFSLDPQGGFIQEARELYRVLSMESQSSISSEEESYIGDHEKGRQALERGQYQKAIYFFKKVIKERPKFWAAYNNLAIAYFSMGEADLGFDVLEQVVRKDPGNIHALCNMATFYDQMDKQDQVTRIVQTLDKLNPIFPEHRNKLGATYFFIGEYEKAYRWLKSADRACSYWDQPFYYWFALTAYQIGKVNEAMRAWEKVDFFSETPYQPLDYGKIRELFKADDALDNPIVKSILAHELNNEESEAKTFVLFYLDKAGHTSARDMLNAFIRQQRGQTPLRSIAETFVHASDDPRVAIMKRLEETWGGGTPLVDQFKLYEWWRVLYEKLEGNVNMIDVDAWAASLIYLWKKEREEKVSQEAIAKTHGITVYRLKKCLDKWKTLV
ncbi:MAG: tetratricopeptide repeat protein [Tuberibacillus sp.]